MVTPRWGRIAIEMVVDFEPKTVAEVAEHIDELSWGTDAFALCLSACAQQTAGNVRVSPQESGGAAVMVTQALAPCLDATANLIGFR